MNYLRLLSELQRRRQRVYRQHVLRYRPNAFTFYNDEEFIQRYRFSKEGVIPLYDTLRNDLKRGNRGCPLSVELQLIATLHFYPTGSFEKSSVTFLEFLIRRSVLRSIS